MPVRTPTLLVLAALTVLPTSLEARSPKAAPTAAADTAPAVPAPRAGMRRFMVVRTFPAGALAGLDATAKKAVNQCNSTHKVEWVHSYANADKTKTFCIYDAPTPEAIRKVAERNGLPVGRITEVGVLDPYFYRP